MLPGQKIRIFAALKYSTKEQTLTNRFIKQTYSAAR